MAAVISDVWSIYELLNDRGDAVLSGVREDEMSACLAFLAKVSVHGPASLPDNRSHHVSTDEPKIWQFDVTAKLRLLWFYDAGKLVVVSHCFYKQGGKKNTTPRDLVEAAQGVFRQYFADKANGNLQIEDGSDDEDQ
ncbi:hypothetical protein BYI23_B000490 [Burkholderia sp. YI23]|nr:hypothetical protein BYI23_B000490 [Burkholderia sp. YI23]